MWYKQIDHYWNKLGLTTPPLCWRMSLSNLWLGHPSSTSFRWRLKSSFAAPGYGWWEVEGGGWSTESTGDFLMDLFWNQKKSGTFRPTNFFCFSFWWSKLWFLPNMNISFKSPASHQCKKTTPSFALRCCLSTVPGNPRIWAIHRTS